MQGQSRRRARRSIACSLVRFLFRWLMRLSFVCLLTCRVQIMRELVVSSPATEELSVEERNLLSVAYKNVIGSRRAAWRTLNVGVDEGKFDDLLLAYRKQVESELSDVCLDVLNLLEDTLVKNNKKENEARVFYLKMTGDYYRYLAEFVTDKQYEQVRHTQNTTRCASLLLGRHLHSERNGVEMSSQLIQHRFFVFPLAVRVEGR